MILELNIQNYALIDQLTLEFSPGLNVLTGETGSGKSIILGALGLVLGEKASADSIRSGASEALVEAVLDIGDYLDLQKYLTDLDLPSEEGTLVLTRRMHKNGKSICRVNARSVPLSILRDLGRYIIDVYGQHEYVSLFKGERQLELIDRYGGLELLEQRKKVNNLYAEYKEAEKKYQNLLAREQEKNYKEELLAFQVEELEKAELKSGEDEELAQEEKILANAERIKELLSRAYLNLYQGDQLGKSVLDGLYQVAADLQEINKFDPSYGQSAEKILSVKYDLEEIARELSEKQEEMETDSYRLQEVQERLAFLNSLKKKYQQDIKGLITYLNRIKEELQFFTDYQQELEKTAAQVQILEEELLLQGEALSEIRKNTAVKLEEKVSQELADLGMQGTIFQIHFSSLIEEEKKRITAQGLDKIEFLFSSNLGERIRPLSAIASGGELSRVMLALKVILAKVDQIPTLIFDEIDTGIGGRTAQVVGEKLAVVSQERQIVCVTHSPQIASMADGHFRISKGVREDRVHTAVDFLTIEERIEELGRMLSGAEVTELTKRHAGEMLEMAQSFKRNLL